MFYLTYVDLVAVFCEIASGCRIFRYQEIGESLPCPDDDLNLGRCPRTLLMVRWFVFLEDLGTERGSRP